MTHPRRNRLPHQFGNRALNAAAARVTGSSTARQNVREELS